MLLSILDKREEFLTILDEIKRDIENLPSEQKKHYAQWEKKARQTFLSLFRKAVELSDAVADLYMSLAFSKYEIAHQTKDQPISLEGNSPASQ